MWIDLYSFSASLHIDFMWLCFVSVRWSIASLFLVFMICCRSSIVLCIPLVFKVIVFMHGAGIWLFPVVRGSFLGIELFVALLWLVGRDSFGFGSSCCIVLMCFFVFECGRRWVSVGHDACG